MGRAICFALFIQPAAVPVKYTPFVLKGDNRTFSHASSPNQSRAYIWIGVDTQQVVRRATPTTYIYWKSTVVMAGDCVFRPINVPLPHSIAVPPSDYNKWEVERQGDKIVVTYDLVLSRVLERVGPHINGTITFSPDVDGFAAYGRRDGFPWAEAYYHDGRGNVQTIFQRPAVRGDPEDLNAIEATYPYGLVSRAGYEARKLLSDPNPRKDVFSVPSGGD
jgi:hypothetical protein